MKFIEDVLKDQDNIPGYSIIDYKEIGIPIYIQYANFVILTKKSFNPILEFIIRAINLNFNNPYDLVRFLGLDEKIIENSVTELIQKEFIFIDENENLQLSYNSKKYLLSGEIEQKPINEDLFFYFDGILQKPVKINKNDLFEPKYLRENKILNIVESKIKKPKTTEINLNELNKIISIPKDTSIIRLREIKKRTLKYQLGYLVIYKNQTKSNQQLIQTRFIINRSTSNEHDLMFIKDGGIDKLGIENSLKINKRFKLPENIKEKVLSHAKITDIKDNEIKIKESVKTVPVYKHPDYLKDCLFNSTKRLIIISPWITPQVVDNEFIESLEKLLQKNVKIYIGYGFSDFDKPLDQNIYNKFNYFSKNFKNFILTNFKNTHAKILVKDNEYFVITSFNWLSFRGDQKRTFREEWGTYISIQPIVNDQIDVILKRFNEK